MGRHGVRAEWDVIPVSIRRSIDDTLGSPVVTAVNLTDGFSPGPAARCDLADGRRVFVKAAGPELNPDSPRIHRREADVLRRLPADHPSPRLIDVVDDGAWVAFVTEFIAGHTPTAPLTHSDVERVLDLLDRVARAGDGFDTSSGIEPFSAVGRGLLGHWALIAEQPPDHLDRWSRAHAELLATIERDAVEASRANALIHLDFRIDNVVFSSAGRDHDVAVDWPGASIGAPWIDLLCLVPSLHLDGGPPPAEVFAAHRLGRDAHPDAVDSVLAALTGFLTRQALQPPPPGLPTVRAFQAAQGRVARRWLAGRLGLTEGLD